MYIWLPDFSHVPTGDDEENAGDNVTEGPAEGRKITLRISTPSVRKGEDELSRPTPQNCQFRVRVVGSTSPWLSHKVCD